MKQDGLQLVDADPERAGGSPRVGGTAADAAAATNLASARDGAGRSGGGGKAWRRAKRPGSNGNDASSLPSSSSGRAAAGAASGRSGSFGDGALAAVGSCECPSDGGSGGGGGGFRGRCRRVASRGFWQDFFTSAPYHTSVIALVLVDLVAVVLDLGVMMAHCPEPHLKPSMHRLLEALTWVSIGILCVFVLEFAAQICCFGPRWCRVPTNVLDAVVVSLSLALEIALRRSDLKDVVGLLIVFRLWRIARIMHATEEILHIEHGKKLHEAEAEAREARAEADAVKAELEAARAALLELQAARALLQQQPQQG